MGLGDDEGFADIMIRLPRPHSSGVTSPWTWVFAGLAGLLMLINVSGHHFADIDIRQIRLGTLADWVGGLGTTAAVVWAVRDGHRQQDAREYGDAREAMRDARTITKAIDILDASLCCLIEVSTIVSRPETATATERTDIERWAREMADRGWSQLNDRWTREGDREVTVDELVSLAPAKLTQPWIVICRVRNTGAESAKIELSRRGCPDSITVAAAPDSEAVHLAVPNLRYTDSRSAVLGAHSLEFRAASYTHGRRVDIRLQLP